MSSVSTIDNEKLLRQRVGEIPILQTFIQRLGFRDVMARYVKSHGNEQIAAVDTLMMLACNLASGRCPMYELQDWVLSIDKKLWGLGSLDNGLINDDRFGRALDKLYLADRSSLMTELVMRVVKETKLDLSRLHNDSTSLKAHGKIPGKTRTGLRLMHGVSKEHRPDLKQLVFSLTISSDGAVPVHYRPYSGNRTDDTTHIETWNTLQKICGRSDFLYVADSKLCTDKQLHHIAYRGGRAITIMPETWSETKDFKDELRLKNKSKKEIWRRKKPGKTDENTEYFSCYSIGKIKTYKRKYAVHWIYSSEKKKRDRASREQSLRKAEQELAELTGKLNTRKFKSKEAILEAAENILANRNVKPFYQLEVTEGEQCSRVQIGKGRPGPKTKYKIITQANYSLCWSRDRNALHREKRVDGVFPLLCTDTSLEPQEVLKAYKYQPRLEKRFTQLRGIHNATPLLFKKIERVEALLFVFFMALILQSVIERTVRSAIKEEQLDPLPIYPEHRLAHHPTTAIIFDRFENLSTYTLLKDNKPIKLFKDDLEDVHLRILKMLGLTKQTYWP